MSELPSDLPRLRVLELYLQLQLSAVRAAITAAETRQGRERPSWPQPAGDPRPARSSAPRARRSRASEWHPHPAGPPPRDDVTPWWRLQPRQGDGPAILHRGDCQQAEGTAIDRGAARVAARERGVRPCFSCQPQRSLAAD